MKDKIEKYGSVIMLYNRMSLYRVLLILAGMGIVQTIRKAISSYCVLIVMH